MPDEQVAKVKTLVAKRDEYLNNMSSIRNRKDELRTELIDAGLIEKNSKNHLLKLVSNFGVVLRIYLKQVEI